MAFMDVLSISLTGVLILYVINSNIDSSERELGERYYTTIEQENDAVDHFKSIIVQEGSNIVIYGELEKRKYFLGNKKNEEIDFSKSSFFEPSKKDTFINLIKNKYNVDIAVTQTNEIPAYIRIFNSTKSKEISIWIGYGHCANSDKDHPVRFKQTSYVNEVSIKSKPSFFHIKFTDTYEECHNCLYRAKESNVPFQNFVKIDIDGIEAKVTHLND